MAELAKIVGVPKADFNARFIVFFVALLLSFQPLSTDLYLPSQQMITQSLSLDVVQAQGTLLGLLLGFAVSQLLWGHYSDRIGRRRILMAGAVTYTLSAVVCMLATSGAMMIAARVAMGCGLAALVVCARALIRDLFDVATGQQAFAKALTGMAVTATLSGVVGGVLAHYVPWRGTLGMLALLGAVVLLTTWRHFDESHEPHRDQAMHWFAQMMAAWRKILVNRAFLCNTGLAAFTYAEAILFIGGSSLVLVRHHGVKPEAIGLFMTAYSACFLAGTMVCRQVLRRGGRQPALKLGLGLSGLGLLAFVLVGLDVTGQATRYLVMAQMLYMLGHGFNQVCSQAGAVAPFPKEAGTAAALSGTLMILCSVVLGQLQAVALSHTPIALVWFSVFNAAMVMGFIALLLRSRTP